MLNIVHQAGTNAWICRNADCYCFRRHFAKLCVACWPSSVDVCLPEKARLSNPKLIGKSKVCLDRFLNAMFIYKQNFMSPESCTKSEKRWNILCR